VTALVATPEGGIVSLAVDLYKRNHGCGWCEPSCAALGHTTTAVVHESLIGTVAYNTLDWASHEEGRTQYRPSWASYSTPELGLGFLSAGMQPLAPRDGEQRRE
jgi:hypothetical protein